MSRYRVAELFAGAGGMALGFHRAGWETAWTAELAEFPSRITKHHWPTVPQYGDVSALDGRELVRRHGPLDMIAGGSPCQDLSIAGKRAGLAGVRSGLFHQQMRLWDETGADLCLWENVAGALSSHNGNDFAAVLSAFVGATVAVPRDGWGGDESGGGVAAGPSGVAAWRLLDAQYFGVAQRRLRVFVLGTRTGRVDPAEILLEPEGVCGHPPARGEARQGTAEGAGDSLARTFQNTGHGWWNEGSVAAGIRTPDGGGSLEATLAVQPLAFHHKQDPISGGVSPSLGTTSDGMGVLAWTEKSGEVTHFAPYAPSLMSGTGATGNMLPRVPAPAAGVVCATGDVTHALTHEGADASEDGTGRGTPIVTGVPDLARCDTAGEGARLDYETTTVLVAGPLESRTNGGGFPGTDGACSGHVVPSAGIPRRLTPGECEKLMSWPPNWTNVPDEKGKPASDAVRYKAIGNGVVANVAQWIAARTRFALDLVASDESEAA